MNNNRLICADVIDGLQQLPAESVHCCVTSPPYWGLRDYGVERQSGLERTPELYIERKVAEFRAVKRVLRSDGTLWVNMGDSYHNGDKGGYDRPKVGKQATNQGTVKGLTVNRLWQYGLKPKDLIGMPWRLALALQADGWYLRRDIIWAKKTPMPESVRDRPTTAHEYVFLLSKSEKYFYDDVAVMEPASGNAHSLSVRNRRSVWSLAAQPYKGAHFATFPEKLVRPCILAGTSEMGCCSLCGAPLARNVERKLLGDLAGGDHDNPFPGPKTIGWTRTCHCTLSQETVPCTVLDPFCGSGTTIVVANRYGRDGIGIDLSAAYLGMAERRIEAAMMKIDQLGS